jgi:hypothetical protein
MRGESPATSLRSLPFGRSRTWSSWISEVRQRRRSIKLHRLETVERLAHQERHTRRSGEYAPRLESARPWY